MATTHLTARRRWGFLLICAAAALALSAGEAESKTPPATQPAATADRYAPRDPATLHVPRSPVTRKTYIDFCRPAAKQFLSGPDHGRYGVRHALPALAVFAAEGDPKLGAGIKKTLRHYGDWVYGEVKAKGGVFSMEGGVLCAIYFRELRKRKMMTPDDEKWARELLLTLRKYQFAWRPGDGYYRGPHHRSQSQGANHALAAAFYPRHPGAKKWQAYADAVWGDWWNYRDVGINDTGYFYSSFGTILRTADVLERHEVFTDPQAKRFLWDRVLYEITPDGAAPPYGAHGGYNCRAGSRIYALELAARHNRDGRYRWVAHRLMNFGLARGFSNNHNHVQSLSHEPIALASIVCDDTVRPVRPDAGSKLLMRKEVIRLTKEQARKAYPNAGGVDCDMVMGPKVFPHKLVFRAGWEPGDMYMLVEAFPRHDPLNPTAILSLERHSAAFAEMSYEKFVPRENQVRIEDLSGTARYRGKKPFRGPKRLPVGYDGMDVRAEAFADAAAATHARLVVTNYMGYDARQTRELLFVKNRFVLVRDETRFADGFRARVGPIWNTQNVGRPRGDNWLNTWFTAHWFQIARLYETQPWDLLVWHAPAAGRKLTVSGPMGTAGALSKLRSTQYAWTGEVKPGMRLQFVSVLLPHAPMRDASKLAAGIEALRDEPGIAAVRVTTAGRHELAALNAPGGRLKLSAGKATFATDARAAYLDVAGGKLTRALLVDATFLTANGRDVFLAAARRTYELPK